MDNVSIKSLLDDPTQFKTHPDHPTYKINRHGEVYVEETADPVVVHKDCRVVLRDKDNKLKKKRIDVLVCQVFYKKYYKRGMKIVYNKNDGYMPDWDGSDNNRMTKLLNNEPCYLIKPKLNYKGELYLNFTPPFPTDSDIKALVQNRLTCAVELFTDTEKAENSLGEDDDVWYFRTNKGKGDIGDDAEALDHILMAKMYYILYKLEELEMGGVEPSLLKDKFFSFDFEDKTDEWMEQLKPQEKPVNTVVKKEETEEEKADTLRILQDRETQKKREWQRQQDQEDEKFRIKKLQTDMAEAEMRRIEAQAHSSIVRNFNATWGAECGYFINSYNDLMTGINRHTSWQKKRRAEISKEELRKEKAEKREKARIRKAQLKIEYQKKLMEMK